MSRRRDPASRLVRVLDTIHGVLEASQIDMTDEVSKAYGAVPGRVLPRLIDKACDKALCAGPGTRQQVNAVRDVDTYLGALARHAPYLAFAKAVDIDLQRSWPDNIMDRATAACVARCAAAIGKADPKHVVIQLASNGIHTRRGSALEKVSLDRYPAALDGWYAVEPEAAVNYSRHCVFDTMQAIDHDLARAGKGRGQAFEPVAIAGFKKLIFSAAIVNHREADLRVEHLAESLKPLRRNRPEAGSFREIDAILETLKNPAAASGHRLKGELAPGGKTELAEPSQA